MRKQVITSVLLIFCASFAWSQSQRRVLIEEVNNVSAPVSAGQSNNFVNWLNNNAEKHATIRYQANTPGTDPMFAAGVEARINYYNLSDIPVSLVDGALPDSGYAGFNDAWYAGAPGGFTGQMIEERFQTTSPFEIEVNFTVSADALTAIATITCTQDVSGSFKLRLAVTEKQVVFSNPVGSGGQSTFKDIFRTFLGGSAGTTINSEWLAGQTETFELSWNHQGIFDLSQLSIVAFIQDDSSKEVYQTGVSSPPLFVSDFTNAIRILNIELPAETCSGTNSYTPTFTIYNTGNADLINCGFLIDINGSQSNQNYTGSLAFLEQNTIALNPVSFTAQAVNTISITCVAVNGSANQDPINSANGTILLTENQISTFINVIINTDCYPEETSWKITDSNGTITLSGGPYTGQANTEITEYLELPGGCYTFEYFDLYGDGLHGSQWNGCSVDGSFTVVDTAGHVLFSYDGSFDLDYASATFEADITNSLQNSEEIAVLNLFPNPARDYFTLEISQVLPGNLSLTIYNALGQAVQRETLTGNNKTRHEINLTSYKSGVYFVTIETPNQLITKKLIVQQ
jgi:hypothetical protein